MRPSFQTTTTTGVLAPVPLNQHADIFATSLFVKLSSTGTYTVEYTSDDVFASNFNPATASWTSHPNMTAKTANADSNVAFPACAVRLNVAANAGTITFIVRQAGI